MPNYTSMIDTSMGQAQGAGFFDPMGSNAIRAALKRRAMRTAANQRRKGTVLSRLLGLGPQEQRQAMIDTERQSGAGMANTLNEAEYNQLAGGQDWARNMLLMRQRQQYEKSQRGGIGAMLGQLAGTGIGAYFGGPMGAQVGGQIGGSIGGSKRPRQTEYDYTSPYG